MICFLHFRQIVLSGLAVVTCGALAQSPGTVRWVSDSGHYMGAYSMADQAMSVTLDGSHYRGHFVQRVDGDGAAIASPAASNETEKNGAWGRAFLFASSAQVIQCELTTGFPAVTGHCTNSEGRRFQLMTTSTPTHAP